MDVGNTKKERLEVAQKTLGRVLGFSKNERIQFRRCLGMTFVLAPRAVQTRFVLLLGNEFDQLTPLERDRVFFAACVLCNNDGNEANSKMEEYLSKVYVSSESKSYPKRIERLFQIPENSNGLLYRKLTDYIKKAKRENMFIDGGALLSDLWWWDANNYVVTKWARTIAKAVAAKNPDAA